MTQTRSAMTAGTTSKALFKAYQLAIEIHRSKAPDQPLPAFTAVDFSNNSTALKDELWRHYRMLENKASPELSLFDFLVITILNPGPHLQPQPPAANSNTENALQLTAGNEFKHNLPADVTGTIISQGNYSIAELLRLRLIHRGTASSAELATAILRQPPDQMQQRYVEQQAKKNWAGTNHNGIKNALQALIEHPDSTPDHVFYCRIWLLKLDAPNATAIASLTKQYQQTLKLNPKETITLSTLFHEMSEPNMLGDRIWQDSISKLLSLITMLHPLQIKYLLAKIFDNLRHGVNSSPLNHDLLSWLRRSIKFIMPALNHLQKQQLADHLIANIKHCVQSTTETDRVKRINIELIQHIVEITLQLATHFSTEQRDEVITIFTTVISDKDLDRAEPAFQLLVRIVTHLDQDQINRLYHSTLTAIQNQNYHHALRLLNELAKKLNSTQAGNIAETLGTTDAITAIVNSVMQSSLINIYQQLALDSKTAIRIFQTILSSLQNVNMLFYQALKRWLPIVAMRLNNDDVHLLYDRADYLLGQEEESARETGTEMMRAIAPMLTADQAVTAISHYTKAALLLFPNNATETIAVLTQLAAKFTPKQRDNQFNEQLRNFNSQNSNEQRIAQLILAALSPWLTGNQAVRLFELALANLQGSDYEKVTITMIANLSVALNSEQTTRFINTTIDSLVIFHDLIQHLNINTVRSLAGKVNPAQVSFSTLLFLVKRGNNRGLALSAVQLLEGMTNRMSSEQVLQACEVFLEVATNQPTEAVTCLHRIKALANRLAPEHANTLANLMLTDEYLKNHQQTALGLKIIEALSAAATKLGFAQICQCWLIIIEDYHKPNKTLLKPFAVAISKLIKPAHLDSLRAIYHALSNKYSAIITKQDNTGTNTTMSMQEVARMRFENIRGRKNYCDLIAELASVLMYVKGTLDNFTLPQDLSLCLTSDDIALQQSAATAIIAIAKTPTFVEDTSLHQNLIDTISHFCRSVTVFESFTSLAAQTHRRSLCINILLQLPPAVLQKAKGNSELIDTLITINPPPPPKPAIADEAEARAPVTLSAGG